jgi:hypothetical protein
VMKMMPCPEAAGLEFTPWTRNWGGVGGSYLRRPARLGPAESLLSLEDVETLVVADDIKQCRMRDEGGFYPIGVPQERGAVNEHEKAGRGCPVPYHPFRKRGVSFLPTRREPRFD